MEETKRNVRGRKGAEPEVHRPYRTPHVVRVAVSTARTITGLSDADINHCTQHYHDQATCPWP